MKRIQSITEDRGENASGLTNSSNQLNPVASIEIDDTGLIEDTDLIDDTDLILDLEQTDNENNSNQNPPSKTGRFGLPEWYSGMLELIGRMPDPAGKAFWQGKLDQGHSLVEIQAGMLESPEYFKLDTLM